MGACCGKEEKNFQGEGRTLGAAPTNAPQRTGDGRAAVPAKISAPQGGKTLGRNPQRPDDSAGPREAAARAAEERSKASSSGGGTLQDKLLKQKQQTQTGLLAESARDNVASRDADAQAQARNWD